LLTDGDNALTAIDVAASSVPTVGDDAVPIDVVAADGASFSYRLGEMRVSVGMAHHREQRQPRETPDWMTSWHTTSTGVLQLEEVDVDVDSGSARATARWRALEPSRWGIDSNPRGPAIADSIAAAGAITEAALFQRANIERDAVGNFWMRRAHIEYLHAVERRSEGAISVSTVRSHVFNRGQSRWHSARVRVESEFGFSIDADVAFEERNSAGGEEQP
jgi:hypothetical protein